MQTVMDYFQPLNLMWPNVLTFDVNVVALLNIKRRYNMVHTQSRIVWMMSLSIEGALDIPLQLSFKVHSCHWPLNSLSNLQSVWFMELYHKFEWQMAFQYISLWGYTKTFRLKCMCKYKSLLKCYMIKISTQKPQKDKKVIMQQASLHNLHSW